jgi:hypothetical protein
VAKGGLASFDPNVGLCVTDASNDASGSVMVGFLVRLVTCLNAQQLAQVASLGLSSEELATQAGIADLAVPECSSRSYSRLPHLRGKCCCSQDNSMCRQLQVMRICLALPVVILLHHFIAETLWSSLKHGLACGTLTFMCAACVYQRVLEWSVSEDVLLPSQSDYRMAAGIRSCHNAPTVTVVQGWCIGAHCSLQLRSCLQLVMPATACRA